jgi:hypothetical protein
MFPGVKFSGSSKEQPSFIHHLKDLHNKGYTHVTMVAGSDRAKDYQDIVDKYNKPSKDGGEFHFKSIKVVSAGHRDPDAEGTEGMSASKMRQHAQEGNYHSFKAGLPSHVTHEHAQQLYNDVRSGMGIKESVFLRFKNWLFENTSTNSISGSAIRGDGTTSGTPTGNISNYAAQNAAASPVAQQMVDQHNDLHNTTNLIGGDDGDGNIKKSGNITNSDVLKKAKK